MPTAAARTGAAVLLGVLAPDGDLDGGAAAVWLGAPPQAAASIAVASTTAITSTAMISLNRRAADSTAASYASPRAPAAWSE